MFLEIFDRKSLGEALDSHAFGRERLTFNHFCLRLNEPVQLLCISEGLAALVAQSRRQPDSLDLDSIPWGE